MCEEESNVYISAVPCMIALPCHQGQMLQSSQTRPASLTETAGGFPLLHASSLLRTIGDPVKTSLLFLPSMHLSLQSACSAASADSRFVYSSYPYVAFSCHVGAHSTLAM